MGQRGQKPTPTAILKLRGSWRGKIRDGEPDLEQSAPNIPPSLTDPLARAEWSEAVALLGGMRVLTKADKAIVAMYADAWADYTHAMGQLGTALIVDGEANPLVKIKKEAWERVLKAARELGFTPSSRSGIKVNGEEKGNSKKRFFAG